MIKKNILRLIENDKTRHCNSEETISELTDTLSIPSVIIEEDKSLLKFSIAIESIDSLGVHHKRRYSLIVIIYHQKQIIELRLDPLIDHNRDKFMYVQKVLYWLKQNLVSHISSLDIGLIIDYIKTTSDSTGVLTSGEDLLFDNGGHATIDIGKDESKTLPFIGELKNMLEEYNDEFKKSPTIKKLLEDFIKEKEEKSDTQWIKLLFTDKNFEAKFTGDYGEYNYCLIQHIFNSRKANLGRERMDHVAEFIIGTKERLEELSPNEPGNKFIS